MSGEVDEHRSRFRTGVFLLRDIVMPDTVSKHLMESGDVESNPGPESCGVCGCQRMKKPTRCSQCLESFCRTDCIGPRWKTNKLLEEGKPLVCRICKGETVSKKHSYNEGVIPDKCASSKCRRKKIYANDDFLLCTQCRRQYHKNEKCSEMTRKQVDRLDRARWQCPTCMSIEEKKRQEEEITKSSEYLVKNSEDRQINIMQLNIDSLKSKVVELRHFLKEQNVDIFLLQETKLIKKDKTPKIPGYTLIRDDREQSKGKANGRGGGLLTGVRDNIPFKEVKLGKPGRKDEITEWQTIEIPTQNKEFIRITNVYVPPIRSQGRTRGESLVQEGMGSERSQRNSERVPQSAVTTTRSRGESPNTYENLRREDRENEEVDEEETEDDPEEEGVGSMCLAKERFDMTRWPHKNHDMIVGDVNAHSPLWDYVVEKTDKRGKIFENWMAANNMVALNQGGPTHTNRKTGKETAPDVAIIHSTALDKMVWRTEDGFGSDHRPIIITLEGKMSKVNDNPNYRWKLSKADWDKYAQEIDNNLPKKYRRKNINKLEKILRKNILKAADKHIGKKKCSPQNKCWMTDEIKEAIHRRNQLRKRMPETRESWIEACRSTAKMINEEKERQWKEYVETVDRSTDGRKIWRTIRAMDGRTPPPRKNEVLVVDDVGYVEDKDKAEQFAKTYKKFSKLPKRKTDRDVRRNNYKRMDERMMDQSIDGPIQESEQDLTMEEMNRAIFGASTNKASGDDDIPYELIQHLGPIAKEFLLHIYQRCWRGEGIPSKWRTAVIKTLLKDGKDPKKTTSYRPISLTSCLGKILERIIADRLIYLLETRKVLNPNQAGFRQGRCTTDQILKLVQDATDNIHSPRHESQRTVVCFFDYEKAYDKVWRDGLISKMLDLDIPPRFVKYVRHFLSGRNTWVEVNNKRSKKFVLKEGLPQGSCISPLLFLIFINDIDADLDFMTAASLFADDTSNWRRDGVVRGSDRILMQGEIDKITDWAERWKMSINADKTKCMVISSSTEDQKWNPKLKAAGTEIEPTKVYRFLGTMIDNNLWFKSHVDITVEKGLKKNKIMKCLSTKSWGWRQETQTQLYCTYNRSALEYASCSWNSWISTTSMKRIQRIQNEALRTAAGLAKTCPVDFVHAETGVEPLEDRLRKNDMIKYEEYLRLEEDDPRRKMLEKRGAERLLTRIGWRTKTEALMKDFSSVCRAPKPPVAPPWKVTTIDFQAVELEGKKSDYSEDELRERSIKAIQDLQAMHLVYTDGSTNANQEKGGAGVYATNIEGEEVHAAHYPAGEMCSSFQAECIAMERALDWIAVNPGECAIITDSMSMWMALKTDDWKNKDYHLAEIKTKLADISSRITLLWVPSHCKIPGNDRADELANQGTKLSQQGVPVSCKIMKARIRRKKWKIKHIRARQVYRDRRKPKFEIEKKWPRKVRSTFSRLRTGHSKLLANYRFLIEKEDSPICECKDEDQDGEEETLEHILCRCSLLKDTRDSMGIRNISPDWMVTEPEKCRELLSARFPELKLGTGTEEDTPVTETRGVASDPNVTPASPVREV